MTVFNLEEDDPTISETAFVGSDHKAGVHPGPREPVRTGRGDARSTDV
jgi:hypothetical protein